MSEVYLSVGGFLVALLALIWAVRDHFVYRKRLRELQRRTLAAQRNLRHLGNLANEVAHEIKNPITAILCSAETLDLLIGNDIEEVHRRSLRYIKEYGDNLLRLVSDFLDLSRAEAGKIEARSEDLEVKPLIESISGLLDSNAIKKKLTLRTHVSEETIAASVDPKHIKQILFNLLHNAIKFTPPGGEIEIAVRQDFPNPFVVIEVSDNGVGIPADELQSLFDPYARYDGDGSSTVEVGTGLGLALCRNLAELNGGSITVESTEGVGTSFALILPLAATHRTPRAKGEVSRALELNQPLHGQRFLVVDEDTGSRESLSRLIEAWGGMVDRVSMAVDALEALGQNPYDAVMIDDTMDGVYGHELARIIRNELELKETTIIVATDEETDERLARASGADRCVEKPLNGRALLESLLKTGKYSVTH